MELVNFCLAIASIGFICFLVVVVFILAVCFFAALDLAFSRGEGVFRTVLAFITICSVIVSYLYFGPYTMLEYTMPWNWGINPWNYVNWSDIISGGLITSLGFLAYFWPSIKWYSYVIEMRSKGENPYKFHNC